MNLIALPSGPPKPASAIIAETILIGINEELSRRIENHSREFHRFWDSAATPDDILAAMGPYAKLMLAASRANLENIHKLAQMVGKTLHDAISPEHWYPRRAFIEGEDGSVTLALPDEGFDAWGRPLPPPIPEGI
jgi:hypothetical protein